MQLWSALVRAHGNGLLLRSVLCFRGYSLQALFVWTEVCIGVLGGQCNCLLEILTCGIVLASRFEALAQAFVRIGRFGIKLNIPLKDRDCLIEFAIVLELIAEFVNDSLPAAECCNRNAETVCGSDPQFRLDHL